MPRSPSSERTPRYDDAVEAATSLFGKHGYSDTSVRMISDALGILSGSLYSIISTKEDVLREIARRVGVAFLTEAEAAVADAGSPEDALRAICAAHLRVIHKRQTAVTVYYNEWRRLAAPARGEIIELRDRYQALITAQVDAGIAEGKFKIAEPRIGVLAILSLLNWTYQWYDPRGSAKPERLADLYMDVVLDGLRSRPGG